MLTLNTAGSNLYLFSCPSPEALVQWTAAMRLAAWEKSRLEEIYTAHLIRITLNDGECYLISAQEPRDVHCHSAMQAAVFLARS